MHKDNNKESLGIVPLTVTGHIDNTTMQKITIARTSTPGITNSNAML